MKLLWTPEAVSDLRRIRTFIQPYHPQAARAAALRIRQAAAALMSAPELGRVDDDAPSLRDFIASFAAGAYVLRYRLYPDSVVVACVWHACELRP